MPWQRNESGNPKGRKKLSAEEKQDRENFLKLLRASTTEALETILEVMHNPRALNRDRISCAKVILERAYGNVPILADNGEEDNVIEFRIVRVENNQDDTNDNGSEWDKVIKELEEEENAKCCK